VVIDWGAIGTGAGASGSPTPSEDAPVMLDWSLDGMLFELSF
jgi:hypothetical protein